MISARVVVYCPDRASRPRSTGHSLSEVTTSRLKRPALSLTMLLIELGRRGAFAGQSSVRW